MTAFSQSHPSDSYSLLSAIASTPSATPSVANTVRTALAIVSSIFLLAVLIKGVHWLSSRQRQRKEDSKNEYNQLGVEATQSREVSPRVKFFELLKPSPALKAFTGNRRRNRARTIDSDASFLVGYPSDMSLAIAKNSSPGIRSGSPSANSQIPLNPIYPSSSSSVGLCNGSSTKFSSPRYNPPSSMSSSSLYEGRQDVIRKPPRAILPPVMIHVAQQSYRSSSSGSRFVEELDDAPRVTTSSFTETPSGYPILISSPNTLDIQTTLTSSGLYDVPVRQHEGTKTQIQTVAPGVDVDCSLLVEAESSASLGSISSYHTALSGGHSDSSHGQHSRHAATNDALCVPSPGIVKSADGPTSVPSGPRRMNEDGNEGKEKTQERESEDEEQANTSVNSTIKKAFVYDYFGVGDMDAEDSIIETSTPVLSFSSSPSPPSSPPITPTDAFTPMRVLGAESEFQEKEKEYLDPDPYSNSVVQALLTQALDDLEALKEVYEEESGSWEGNVLDAEVDTRTNSTCAETEVEADTTIDILVEELVASYLTNPSSSSSVSRDRIPALPACRSSIDVYKKEDVDMELSFSSLMLEHGTPRVKNLGFSGLRERVDAYSEDFEGSEGDWSFSSEGMLDHGTPVPIEKQIRKPLGQVNGTVGGKKRTTMVMKREMGRRDLEFGLDESFEAPSTLPCLPRPQVSADKELEFELRLATMKKKFGYTGGYKGGVRKAAVTNAFLARTTVARAE